MEIFRDGKLKAFEQLQKKNDMKQILQIRDQEKRSPLHLVCKNGFQQFALKVIELHRFHGLSLDPIDNRGDTPLLNLFSHGSDENFQNLEDASTQMKYNEMLKAKEIIVKSLLKKDESIRADIKKSVNPKKNNPLHWAIYYGAMNAGKLLFEEFPLMILRKNKQDLTPIELIVKKLIRKPFKMRSKELVRYILTFFTKKLIQDNSKFNQANEMNDTFLNNSSKEERSFFQILKDKYQNKQNIMLLNKVLKNPLFTQKSGINFQTKKSEIYRKSNSNQIFPIEEEQDIIKKDKSDKKDSFEKISDEENVPKINLQNLFQQKEKIQLKIYDHKTKANKNNPYIIFMHKLLLIAVYLELKEVIEILLNQFQISPFFKSMDDISAILYASKKGKNQFVDYFLDFDYEFDSDRKFDWKIEINKRGGEFKNTCLHFVAIKGNVNMYQKLVGKGADIDKYNYLDFRAFELSSNQQLLQANDKIQNDIENQHLKELIPDPLNTYSFDKNVIELINEDYIYLIIARDVEKEVNKTLMYKQLKNLQKRFENLAASLFSTKKKENEDIDEEENQIIIDNIKFKHILPVKNKQSGYFRHYFVLNFSSALIKAVASFLGFEIYNKKKKYKTSFSLKNHEDFHQFRDYHIHEIIHFVLNKEFDVEQFKKIKLIEDAFPLHEFKTRQNIVVNWKKEKKTVILDPLKARSSLKDIRPFNSIAFYFGCDVALYSSYTLLMTSFLMVLGIIGLIIELIIIIKGPEFYLNAIYAICVTLWVTFVLEKWKNRQNVHADIWNADKKKNNEVKQKKYRGDYQINKITKQIEKKNLWSIVQRRIYVIQKD